MILVATLRGLETDVELVDQDDFGRLKLIVRVPHEVSVPPGDISSLSSDESEGWRMDFDRMVAYAATRGWVDETGAVRVHVEVESAAPLPDGGD